MGDFEASEVSVGGCIVALEPSWDYWWTTGGLPTDYFDCAAAAVASKADAVTNYSCCVA